ncbi:hypothetical protein FQ192_14080 [Pseudomonas sp. ANT_J12]|nr:hypothetical protein FQ192_14080 [Pseudomonas sp. ANT_J12]
MHSLSWRNEKPRESGVFFGPTDRSHALRGNASMDALRPLLGRGASRAAFPRRAWERSNSCANPCANERVR